MPNTHRSSSSSPENGILWSLPYSRNPNFTGRDAYLEDLHKAFASADVGNRVQVIHGLGGMGKTQLALEYAYRHRDEYKKMPQPACPMGASVHHNLGLTYQAMGRFDEAREHLERALEVADGVYGPSHVAIGRDLDSLAALHFATGDYAKARVLCERSLAIAQTAHVQSQTDVAARLRNLARVAKAMGDVDRSVALHEQAAAMTNAPVNEKDEAPKV